MSPLQARYILQYIQTFTIDTLTIWQTIAAGQHRASGSAVYFRSDQADLRSASNNLNRYYICRIYIYKMITK